MSEEKRNPTDNVPENGTEYQAPAIEDIVTSEGLEREVAYAGGVGNSNLIN